MVVGGVRLGRWKEFTGSKIRAAGKSNPPPPHPHVLSRWPHDLLRCCLTPTTSHRWTSLGSETKRGFVGSAAFSSITATWHACTNSNAASKLCELKWYVDIVVLGVTIRLVDVTLTWTTCSSPSIPATGFTPQNLVLTSGTAAVTSFITSPCGVSSISSNPGVTVHRHSRNTGSWLWLRMTRELAPRSRPLVMIAPFSLPLTSRLCLTTNGSFGRVRVIAPAGRGGGGVTPGAATCSGRVDSAEIPEIFLLSSQCG